MFFSRNYIFYVKMAALLENLVREERTVQSLIQWLSASCDEVIFVTFIQGCKRYFLKVSPIFYIDAGFKSIVDTDIDTLP